VALACTEGTVDFVKVALKLHNSNHDAYENGILELGAAKLLPRTTANYSRGGNNGVPQVNILNCSILGMNIKAISAC
jgi:hypothetical protein